MMKLTVLVENTAGNKCLAEHGLSYLIEADRTILFDTGASDLFIQNARQLNIDLENVKTVVLSHGHYDHSNGLFFLKNKKLICHPDTFIDRYRKAEGTPLGIQLDRNKTGKLFEVETSREPLRLSEQIWFLGEVPRRNNFESKETAFMLEDGSDDFTLDDSGLAIVGNDGLIVVSGCAHAGICNTVDHAMRITGQQKVQAVIGGFHLKRNDELTRQTIEHLKRLNVQQVIPAHCTMLPALAAFYAEWQFVQLKSGNMLKF
ncbi:MAG: MBL fold metallo-hydrolase [Prolixibacteraceae bacterium]|jgi:7,8-dihydropterin-6-yl-methyl-4-(beta-D-ribofuranosyl)aminobenzene 5'-phosphate synthase|nr:MBL fold metallo-hydrolase [Prolixibacteraceae bacterium]